MKPIAGWIEVHDWNGDPCMIPAVAISEIIPVPTYRGVQVAIPAGPRGENVAVITARGNYWIDANYEDVPALIADAVASQQLAIGTAVQNMRHVMLP